MVIPVVASCSDGGEPRQFPVRDVTAVGAYVVTAERWYPGTIVTMTFRYDPSYLRVVHINGDARAAIQMRAKIMRHGTDGVGVRFLYGNQDQRREFEKFLAGGQVRGEV